MRKAVGVVASCRITEGARQYFALYYAPSTKADAEASCASSGGTIE
ncbi:MAG: hypothetical protein FJ087_08475 [Deltaproteobacteria bacterium]|nr:hypothetical protein [Deltaproteobacteria bacterium]